MTDAVTQCSHVRGIAFGSKMCTVPPLLPTGVSAQCSIISADQGGHCFGLEQICIPYH